MKKKELSKKIKNLRYRKGFSQEELSENSGLSLRTIQRIENGETEPRGDSLKRLAMAFDVSSEEIIDWTVREDKNILVSLNVSALTFIAFPLLGIIVPLIFWVSKKDKIININSVAKDILNFQITWTLLFFIGYLGILYGTFYQLNTTGDINISTISFGMTIKTCFLVIMYCYNFIMILINTFRIINDKKTIYVPKINFLKK